MGKSTAPLRVVAGGAAFDPEAELAALFAVEAQLARLQGDVRQALESARQNYREAQGLMALPRMELLRERYAPRAQAGPQ